MGAKELKQYADVYMTGFLGDPILWRYQFKEHELKAFCEQLCLEQREICAERYNRCDDDFNEDAILTAPNPEI